MSAILRLCAAAATALSLAAFPVAAHEGHDHGGEQATAPAPGAAPRAEAASETFELVAVARDGKLTIYVDRLRSNEPVTDATVTVETPVGSETAALAKDRGIYELAAPWAQAGSHALIFTVAAGDNAEILPATLDIPAEAGDGHVHGGVIDLLSHFVEDVTRGATVPAVLFAALAGGILGVSFGRWSARGPGTAALIAAAVLLGGDARAHEGHSHDVPQAAVTATPGARDLARRAPDGSLFVPKDTQRLLAIRTTVTAEADYRRTIELPGRVVPDPNASGYVQASVGGRVSPPDTGFPRLGMRVNKGDVLAYVTPPIQAIDLSDMRQRQGELDQQINIVERRIARFESLVQGGAVTRVQLEEAKLELQGLQDRRAALDRIRQQPEALVAPVSGVVAEINAVAGQMAQTNTVLFQIVEPSRLWIEALSFDTLSAANNATAKTGDGRTLTVSYQGAGFSDRSQSVPVHFRIESEASGLRLGQFVTVFAETEEVRRGLAVPRASVVRTQNGQDLVFEHVAAERFVPHSVRVEQLDGSRVLIMSGMSADARIVTQGAELLDQVR